MSAAEPIPTCDECAGQGIVAVDLGAYPTIVHRAEHCPRCDGSGWLIPGDDVVDAEWDARCAS